jgi:uncharacterized protein (DUF1499 family)
MSRVFAGLLTPIRQLLSGRGLPSIHDITTDPDDPPSFSAVLPQRTDQSRGGKVSSPDYDGADAAKQQRHAYPDIIPLELEVSPERALDEAVAVARELGWDVVAVDRARGVVEAVDTTFWFRFRDDIVVRVREKGSGSRVDVRSKSRVGRGDLGANARRIRMFLTRLAGRLKPAPTIEKRST